MTKSIESLNEIFAQSDVYPVDEVPLGRYDCSVVDIAVGIDTQKGCEYRSCVLRIDFGLHTGKEIIAKWLFLPDKIRGIKTDFQRLGLDITEPLTDLVMSLRNLVGTPISVSKKKNSAGKIVVYFNNLLTSTKKTTQNIPEDFANDDVPF